MTVFCQAVLLVSTFVDFNSRCQAQIFGRENREKGKVWTVGRGPNGDISSQPIPVNPWTELVLDRGCALQLQTHRLTANSEHNKRGIVIWPGWNRNALRREGKGSDEHGVLATTDYQLALPSHNSHQPTKQGKT
ncbi:hypothetical protein BDW69DRAFT_156617 [Aspergillus filifer]